jgi:hypothetical protein
MGLLKPLHGREGLPTMHGGLAKPEAAKTKPTTK